MTTKQNVYNEEWKTLPWKNFEKTLFHLQHRLYKASRENNPTLCRIKQNKRTHMGQSVGLIEQENSYGTKCRIIQNKRPIMGQSVGLFRTRDPLWDKVQD